MTDYATKKDVENIVEKAVEDLSEVISTFAQQVDERFNKVEKDIKDIKRSIDRLTNTIDGFVKRLDDQDIENAARDAQFEKLVIWAKKVSEKTGIPLENL